MPGYCFGFPILPGKGDIALKEVPDYTRAHMDEYERARREAGITRERVYHMPTPMGDFVVMYGESDNDFATTNKKLLGQDTEFMRTFRQKNKEASGFDFSADAPPPEPELVAEWRDPEVGERKKGLAFIAPLAPGKTEAARAFARQAFVDRKNELTESRRKLRQSVELIYLLPTPMGDFVCVYLEGEDPGQGNRGFAASQSAYDKWFKDECLKVFAPGIDFNQPLPPITTIWDWQAARVPA
jgi:hypothetical protein